MLDQLGVEYSIQPQDIDESPLQDELPHLYVERLAREKAAQALKQNKPKTVVLAADTTVVAKGKILGKPESQLEAQTMLSLLSGTEHSVLTGIAVGDQSRLLSQVVRTIVRFREISPEEAAAYWNTGEPVGKAGAYGIQGYAAAFVEHISGSHSNVVGLPLFEVALLLQEFGVPIWGMHRDKS